MRILTILFSIACATTTMLADSALAVNEVTFTFVAPEEIRSTLTASVPEKQAASMRQFADSDEDGTISDDEAVEFENEIRERTEDNDDPGNSFLNDKGPIRTAISSFKIDGLRGPVDSSDEIIGHVRGTLLYPTPTGDEFVWRLVVPEDRDGRKVSVQAPPGFTITTSRGIDRLDGSEAAGTMIAGETVSLTFLEASASKEVGLPGVGAVVGIMSAALMGRGKQRAPSP